MKNGIKSGVMQSKHMNWQLESPSFMMAINKSKNVSLSFQRMVGVLRHTSYDGSYQWFYEDQ